MLDPNRIGLLPRVRKIVELVVHLTTVRHDLWHGRPPFTSAPITATQSSHDAKVVLSGSAARSQRKPSGRRRVGCEFVRPRLIQEENATPKTRPGGQEMASSPSSSSPLERIRPIVPKLAELTEKVLFGDVWERPGLSKRDRSLITCAALLALQRPDQLRGHLQRALDNGVTKDELSELITHLAFYSGWPTAVTAAGIAKEVFEKR